MKKVLFIVGPTGVGKTALAFNLASKFNGTLVSADSIQVFKGLDIVSGKDLPKDYSYHAGYFTHSSRPSICLLDLVEPTTQFSVSDFYKKATEKISEIHNAGKLPIVVGGTGLYVEVLLNGLKSNAKPNLELRKKLELLTVFELQKLIPVEKLKGLNDSDRNNKRRLIRTIEVLKQKPKSTSNRLKNFESMVLGLRCDRDTLKGRIEERVNIRLKEGALGEADKLLKNYENLTNQVRDANGYKQLFMFLRNEINYDEAIYRWKISEYRHAKNQMTWFQKYGDVEWLQAPEDAYYRIESFLQK